MRLFNRRREPPTIATQAEASNAESHDQSQTHLTFDIAELESLLAKLREQGLHGEASAAHLANPERFELPDSDDDLRIMVLDRNFFPFRQGLVVGIFADVMLGWRSIPAAIAEVRQRASRETLPQGYCDQIEFVAASFSGDGRAREAVVLSVLLVEATDAVYGVGSQPWTCGARAFLQAANRVRDTNDPALRAILPAAPQVAQALEQSVRGASDGAVSSSSLSVLGQYWWMASHAEEGKGVSELRKADWALRAAADLREAAERGRTLATLCQVQYALHNAGAMNARTAAATAREALELVDRTQRPRQWLAARRVLGELEPEDGGAADHLTLSDLEQIRGTLGDNVAAECLGEEVRALTVAGDAGDALEMLRCSYSQLRHEQVDQPTRKLLLTAAAHAADGGCVPCRTLSASEADGLFDATTDLPAEEQMLARLHLGLHAQSHRPAIDWLIANGTPVLNSLGAGPARDGARFGLALIHGVRASDPTVTHMLAFRAALLGASITAHAGLLDLAVSALALALERARDWAATCLSNAQPGHAPTVAEVDASGIIDACLRETGMLDALLGDAVREWTLELGRVVAAPMRLGSASTPFLTVAHSAAFKGPVTARLLAAPGPAPVDPEVQQTLHELAAIRDGDEQTEPVVTGGIEELHLCAWLHAREQESGSTASKQRTNLEHRFDDRYMSRVAMRRDPWNRGLHELGFEHLADRFEPGGPSGFNAALLDLYLGRDENESYCMYLNLFFRREWQRYKVELPYEEMTVLSDPGDPTSHLLTDGMGLAVAELRGLVQEPAAHRPVSRAGADALDRASDHILGPLRSEFRAVFDAGCDQLVICPHGPLAFAPLHLLPVGSKLLADHATVAVLPAIGTTLSPPPPRRNTRDLSLGIAASPNGGIAAGLPAEPRIWEQAQQLAEHVPGARLLGLGQTTPAATLELLTKSRFVHIASHGAGLGSAPSFHRLYLDPNDSDPGVLLAYNVLATDLRGLELITLCACETAVGRADPAGNLRGLSTAFLAAGAEAVISALWPVRADAALHFFSSLYGSINEGLGPQSAYRAAQAATRTVFPRFADWGAFVYMIR